MMLRTLKKHFFFSFMLVLIGTSCKVDNSNLMPNVTGKAGEVVIIMEKNFWEGKPGRELIEQLGFEVDGLPQGEPMLDLVNIPKAAFTNIFQTHRNLIITKVSGNYKESKVLVRKNVYARPQIVIQIEAPNSGELTRLIEERGRGILNKILDKERNRIIANYRKYEQPSISDKLSKSHQLMLTVPRGYNYDMDSTDFVWISHEEKELSQGIFVYHYPYQDTSSFNKENLISKRDAVLKRNVAGPNEGTYMTTEKDLPISYREFMLNERYTTELKGLWKLEGPGFMAGPFISLSTVDKERNRIITVEGYVFAPNKDKRNYLRQLEAILHTLKIKAPQKAETK